MKIYWKKTTQELQYSLTQASINSDTILLAWLRMTKLDELTESMRKSPQNVQFNDLAKVCEHYFGKSRQNGTSHKIYKTPWAGDPRVNIQNDKGKAKPYQVRQVLMAIERMTGETKNV